jgi:hypothetical protein
MKIIPVESELLHADGETDMTELTVAFINFTNAPKTGGRVTQIATSFRPRSSNLLQNLKTFNYSALCVVLTRHFQCITNLVSFASESKTEFFRMPGPTRCFVL